MRGVFSGSLFVVFWLAAAGTYGNNELQSNTTTAKCKSPSGMPGMPGTPGIPGAPGSPGRDGFKGEKGTNGKRGLQGLGIPGKIGPRGLEGPKGDKGENGTAIPGNTGPRGLPGYKGDKGRKGEIGTMGTKGSAGIPGYAGPRGPKGSKGENGIGTKGEKGDAENIDPRQLANWKQCGWRETSDTDNGKIKECSFNKLHSNTALKVSYQGNIHVYGNGCNRWYFKFNGNECSGPMTIDSALYNDWRRNHSTKPDNYRPHSFEGYCENLARGAVSVELWVGQCPSGTLGDAYTG